MNLRENIEYYKNRPAHILQGPDARHFWATFPDTPAISADESETLRTAMEQHNPMQLFTFIDYYLEAQRTGEKLYGGWPATTVEPVAELLYRINGANWR